MITVILISACLLGVNCKYNGENNLKDEIIEYFKGKGIIPICPEQLGGLPTPRLPAEIKNGNGQDVLKGKAKVINSDGIDATEQFIKGAYETFKLAETLGATKAILKTRSPSCGVGGIYNGDFNGTLIEGDGVTAALLKSKGLEVYDDRNFLFFVDRKTKGGYVMIDFKKRLSNILSKSIPQLAEDEILTMIEIPPNTEMGDFAFPCFRLAKVFKKAPNIIASDIAKNLDKSNFIDKVEIAGGYLNFFIDKKYLVKTVLEEVLFKKETYGSSSIGNGKNVIVEFSSPNIAKPFHIGHIRTTVIGNSLYKIYKFLGYNTITINHLGDYGTQFGKLIVAFKNWGDEEEVKADPIPTLLNLYVKFHEEAETKPELEDEGREWFKKLENGDEEAVRLWEWFREVSLDEFNRVYNMLDITFDSFTGESFYSDKMPAVVSMMEEKGIMEKSKGADIVDLEPFGMPPALIKKGDGSTLYITRDLAAAIYRKETYDFYKNIYVVGSQQILHFQQLKKILHLMDLEWEKDCVHVPFGMVSLEDGTMSTREGRVVFLEDVLNKAIEKTKDIINEKNPDLENLDEVAKQVGIGAVIFEELSNNRIKDYTFTWDKVLNFEGETGPYVQYTHARAASVLRRAGIDIDNKFKPELLIDDITLEVLRQIQQFPEIIRDAQRKNEPSIVTRHIIDIAQAFNRFYHEHPILVEDEELRKARLAVVFAVKQVISIGLGLLGIQAPERM